MYHKPRMCRTCLQMQRGDFKFVSLDSVDPLWNANSPNLKAQLISLVPDMKIEGSEAHICTSCFIALRTAYEFKRMCQVTEEKYRTHNYKYRKPFGIGPGSSQFHVTLNETSHKNLYHSQDLNYLQADTSIDITEHHLYEASKAPTRNLLTAKNGSSKKLPENDADVLPEARTDDVSLPEMSEEKKKTENECKSSSDTKHLDSSELRKMYNIGSQISILKTHKSNKCEQNIIKLACEEIPYLKTNNIGPDALRCSVQLEVLTQEYLTKNLCTADVVDIDDLKQISDSYYFENLSETINCNFCSQSFWSKFLLFKHEADEHATSNYFECLKCNAVFEKNAKLKEHMEIHNNTDKSNESDKLPSTEVATNKTENDISQVKLEDIESTLKVNLIKKDNAEVSTLKEENDVSTIPKEESNEVLLLQEQQENKVTKNSADPQESVVKPQTASTPNVSKSPTMIDKNKIHKQEFNICSRLIPKYQGKIKYSKCFICNRYFRNKRQLFQHCSFVHIPFTNPDFYWRNVIFKRREALKNLKTTFNFETTKEDDLLVPTDNIRTDTLQCNVCYKTYSNSESLTLHMSTHTSTTDSINYSTEERPNIFTCKLCGKSFPKERYLKMHDIQVHQRAVSITCNTCNRLFKSMFWYHRHKCLLSSENPVTPSTPVPLSTDESNLYSCNFCTKTFAGLRFLKSHKKRIHKDILVENYRLKMMSKMDREPLEIENLESDIDPMKLCTVAGSLSYDGEENIIEINSDSEEELDYISDNVSLSPISPLPPPQEDLGEEPQIEDYDLEPSASHLFAISDLFDQQAEMQINNTDTEVKRKSLSKSLPKIQCDFCGEYIPENEYDDHINNHNKARLQKRQNKSDNLCLEDIEQLENNPLLKCHICSKTFKRKHHLVKHIESHDDDDEETNNTVLSIPVNSAFISAKEEIIRRTIEEKIKEMKEKDGNFNSEKPYQCCGRFFRMKAHFVRHYKYTHSAECVPELHLLDSKASVKEELNLNESSTKPANDQTKIAAVEEVQPILKEEIQDTKPSIKEEKQDEVTIIPVTPVNNKRKSPTEELECEAKKKIKVKEEPQLQSIPEVVKNKRTYNNIDYTELENEESNSARKSDVDSTKIPKSSPFRHKCHLCKKWYRQKCQLRDHLNSHVGIKPYKCEFCIPSRGFTQRSSLYFHLRKFHPLAMQNCQWELHSRNGACIICAEIFKRHAQMFSHLRKYFVDKEYQCEVCNQSYNMVCHYTVHNIDPNEVLQNMMPQNSLEVVLTENSDKVLDVSDTAKRSISSLEENNVLPNEENLEIKPPKKKRRKIFKCNSCHESFGDKHQLKMHKKTLAHLKLKQQRSSVEKETNDIPEETNIKTEEEANDDISEIKSDDGQEKSNYDTVKEESDTTTEDTNDDVPILIKEDIRNSTEILVPGTAHALKFSRKRHRCDICNKDFVKKLLLRKHKRTHRSPRKPIDSMTFNDKETNSTDSMDVTDVKNVKQEIPTNPIEEVQINVKIEPQQGQEISETLKGTMKEEVKVNIKEEKSDESELLHKDVQEEQDALTTTDKTWDNELLQQPKHETTEHEPVLSSTSSRNQQLPEEICNTPAESENITDSDSSKPLPETPNSVTENYDDTSKVRISDSNPKSPLPKENVVSPNGTDSKNTLSDIQVSINKKSLDNSETSKTVSNFYDQPESSNLKYLNNIDIVNDLNGDINPSTLDEQKTKGNENTNPIDNFLSEFSL